MELAVAATGPLLARCVPVAGYVILSRGRSMQWRGAWIVGLAVLFAGASSLERVVAFVLVDVALASTWFLFAALVVNLQARVAAKMPSIPYLAHFVFLLAVAMVLPLRLFPDQMAVMVGPIGWEFWLSSYSYVHYTSSRRDFSLGDCLFFLLVNPMLVFRGHRDRAQTEPQLAILGLPRVLAGYGALSVGLFVSSLLSGPVPAVGLVFLVSQYATHSGRASEEIGLLRLLGYRIAERYRYPLFAKDPQQFWQRWNIYVAAWARTYLFLPFARLAKRCGFRSTYSIVLAVLATFVVVGLMHDVGALWQPTVESFGFTVWFAANGVLVVSWRAFLGPLEVRLRARGLGWVVHVLFVVTMVGVAAAGVALISGR